MREREAGLLDTAVRVEEKEKKDFNTEDTEIGAQSSQRREMIEEAGCANERPDS